MSARFLSPSARRRAVLLATMLAGVALAVWLVLQALEDNLVFYRTPAQLNAQSVAEGQRLRVGGYVESGSVARQDTQLSFKLTDFTHAINIAYNGLEPDLFREGQGVIVEGTFNKDGIFIADILLAKHDENYAPPLALPPAATKAPYAASPLRIND